MPMSQEKIKKLKEAIKRRREANEPNRLKKIKTKYT